MKKVIILLIGFLQFNFVLAQSTYDISFTGGQWEDANGVIIDPNGGTGCLTTIYNSFLVQVAGGGYGAPGNLSYPLADGGATIEITSVDATILSIPSGSFSGYFTWSLVNNVLTGVQNSAIPMTPVVYDPLNGLNFGRIVVPIETPNIQNQTYSVKDTVWHNNLPIYNSSTDADVENNDGQNNEECILPVYLTKFNARNINETGVLTWTSSLEVNASHFEIQRSSLVIDGNDRGETLDKSSMTTLGEVEVTGSRSDYSFVDQNPLSGINYYRLKMVDLDGSISYSPVRAVEFKQLDMDVYPNPFLDNVIFDLGGSVDKIIIYTASGSMIKAISVKGMKTYQMDLTEINSGIYFAELIRSQDSESKMFKLIKIGK